jgi:isochorismate hydrolase
MVSDCCAALSDDEHRAALETIIQQFGDVMTSDEVMQRLKGEVPSGQTDNISKLRTSGVGL